MVQLSVVPDDRRARTRDKKRQRYLDAASRIIDRDGVGGVTMQAIADELDCAIGTIYTYFPSKAALVSALQAQAVAVLGASYAAGREQWQAFLAAEAVDEDLVPLVHLHAYAGFFCAASVVLADEFALQRTLLSARGVTTPRDGRAAKGRGRGETPTVMAMLAAPRDRLDEAVEAGALASEDPLERAVRWLGAMNGVLMVDQLADVDRHLFRGAHLAKALTVDLLVGWGAAREDVEVAASHAERLAALGPMAPPPE
jgi:AcrR family transcriptional regulator